MFLLTSNQLWIDADDPSRSISGDEARTLIKKLVAGFRYAGLKPGDAVCIASYSEVCQTALIIISYELSPAIRYTTPFSSSES